MPPLFRILTRHAVKDLLTYKSFFLLMLFLIFLDRLLHVYTGLGLPPLKQLFMTADPLAVVAFEKLPGILAQLLLNPKTTVILAGLFVLKQFISLWPSSDMRLMHRHERHGFGVVKALVSLRLHQIAWDAVALALLCGALGVWIGGWYVPCRIAWQLHPATVWLWIWAALVCAALPIALAGFSYSSKLAILSQATFPGRLRLFLELVTCRRVFIGSWVFFLTRLMLEVLFVVLLPAAILSLLPFAWFRIALAALIATPVYGFLKMASFKFFLYAYQPYRVVQKEYREYYRALATAPLP